MLGVHQLTRPLFRFDPGWLFIAAGLSVCASVMILPAQGDFHGLGMQLDQLRNEETRAYARLKAHSDFMDQVERADPSLIRRLAATQLNMVPEGDTPVLLAASASVPVTHWIESAVKVDMRPPKAAPDTMLSKLVNGPYRLWIFGCGIMAVFFGVILGTHTVNSRRAAPTADVIDEDVMFAADDDDAGGLALAMDEVDAANELLTADQVSGRNEIPVDELGIRESVDETPATDRVQGPTATDEMQRESASLVAVDVIAVEVDQQEEMNVAGGDAVEPASAEECVANESGGVDESDGEEECEPRLPGG